MRASLNQAVTDTLAKTVPVLRKHAEGELTFELQRVTGPYFHSSAYGLSRPVNHLIVGKSNIKFLKLSHGSSPLLRRSASLQSSALSPAAASPRLETSDVTLTTH